MESCVASVESLASLSGFETCVCVMADDSNKTLAPLETCELQLYLLQLTSLGWVLTPMPIAVRLEWEVVSFRRRIH